MPIADALFVHGNILTMHGSRPVEAVAVHAGKVIAAGDEGSLRGLCSAATRIIDLEGRTMLPGFEDAHAHIWKLGQLLTTSLDLRGCTSIATMGAQLQERHRILPQGSWLQGRGFNEVELAEHRLPTRADLDRDIADRPILLTRTCGHIFIVNSCALRMAGITRHTIAPEGGRIEHDASGEPNGILHETAVGLIQRILPPPTKDLYRTMIRAALHRQLSFGITSSSDCGVVPELLQTYREMALADTLPARMNVMPLGKPDDRSAAHIHPERCDSPMLSVNTIKFLADGGLSGGTAALSVPYPNSTSHGVMRFQQEELFEFYTRYQNEGWRLCTHAIGDAAIELVLSLYEKLHASKPSAAHRIEHLGLVHPHQLQRMARIASVIVTQPIFLDELGANFDGFVPESLANLVYPFRSMLNAGLTVAFSSDAPVVRNDAPLKGIEAALTRRTHAGQCILPAEKISIDEALHAYTVAGAEASGNAASRGSMQEGRWADFVVLDEDPRAVEPEAIGKIHVAQTYLAGKLVYENSGVPA
jgi:predicted amidohydrolase YtcJ